jgi:hypothetical protein
LGGGAVPGTSCQATIGSPSGTKTVSVPNEPYLRAIHLFAGPGLVISDWVFRPIYDFRWLL